MCNGSAVIVRLSIDDQSIEFNTTLVQCVSIHGWGFVRRLVGARSMIDLSVSDAHPMPGAFARSVLARWLLDVCSMIC